MNGNLHKNWFLEILRKQEILIHIVFWIIYIIFPYVKSITNTYQYHFLNELNDLIFGMIVFYIIYLVVLPSKKKVLNSILVPLLFGILAYSNLKIHDTFFGGSHQESFWYYGLGYFSTYTMLFLFAYVLYSIKKGYEQQQIIEKSNIEKQQAELSSLKAQINPHFLFNTLNMIYSSALKKEDQTPELIVKLSDNFRYLLQKGANNKVNVNEDLIHLKNYISLQKERLSNKVRVNLIIDIDDHNQLIAPLLFLPFVENAFKYVSTIKGSKHPIDIHIRLKHKKLTFGCKNPFNTNSKMHMDIQWQKSGIGIDNTKKRLDFFYKNSHKLDIVIENNNFIVNLQIRL